MIIQINTDKNLDLHLQYEEKMKTSITEGLHRFSDHITRIEAHLSDENGGKTGVNDKKCLLEARMEGKQPVAVTHFSHTYDDSLDGAIHKLKNMLTTITGKQSTH